VCFLDYANSQRKSYVIDISFFLNHGIDAFMGLDYAFTPNFMCEYDQNRSIQGCFFLPLVLLYFLLLNYDKGKTSE